MHCCRRLTPRLLLVAVSMALPMLASAAATMPEQVLLNSKDLKWGAAPPGLPKGAKVVVLYGNPASPGTYVMRVMAPSGYKLAPHWHAQPQVMTVISGTVSLTTMDDYGNSTAETLKSGAFVRLPAKARQVLATRAKTVLEIHGEGPFDMNYVNPSDDPQRWAQGKPYYFPSQYELHAVEQGAPAPSF